MTDPFCTLFHWHNKNWFKRKSWCEKKRRRNDAKRFLANPKKELYTNNWKYPEKNSLPPYRRVYSHIQLVAIIFASSVYSIIGLGLGYSPPPHPTGTTPPPRDSSEERILATRRAVRLLWSRRRTFLLYDFFSSIVVSRQSHEWHAHRGGNPQRLLHVSVRPVLPCGRDTQG